MKSRIGPALEEELRGVRMDGALKDRVRTRVASEHRGKRRRSPALRISAVAAAATLLLVGAGVILALTGPRIDAQRTSIAAPNGGAEALAPAARASLTVTATAWEGGVFALESAYSDAPERFEANGPGALRRAEAAVDAAGAAAALGGGLGQADILDWLSTRGDGALLGVRRGAVDVRLNGESAPAGETFRFTGTDDAGLAATLVLSDGAWTADAVQLELAARLESRAYDGESLWRGDTAANCAVQALEGGTFAVQIEAPDGGESLPAALRVPVQQAGRASIWRGVADWLDVGTDSGKLSVEATLAEYGASTAILLKDAGGRGITARVHAVQRPALTLDALRHPGMAGWIFAGAPDEEDVLEVVNEDGLRVTFSVAELRAMLGQDQAGRELIVETDENEGNVSVSLEEADADDIPANEGPEA